VSEKLVLLAKTWDESIDPAGYLMSEKLDGVRATWDGRNFVSRLGNVFPAPASFKRGMPDFALDGELWLRRKAFPECVSIVKSFEDKGWDRLWYRVFDAPQLDVSFSRRYAYLIQSLKGTHPRLNVVKHTECRDMDHMLASLREVEALGGEGLMLRDPSSFYEKKRSSTLLKVKTMHDAEARVIGHAPGKGRHEGRLGALVCELPSGVQFEVGTGLTDAERDHPPRRGSIITFRYQELSRDGVPRFPSFVRVRR
jgi:DNA ligase-1